MTYILKKNSVWNVLRTFNFLRMDSHKQFDCLFINFWEKFENKDESVFIQKVLPGFHSIHKFHSVHVLNKDFVLQVDESLDFL